MCHHAFFISLFRNYYLITTSIPIDEKCDGFICRPKQSQELKCLTHCSYDRRYGYNFEQKQFFLFCINLNFVDLSWSVEQFLC